MRLIDANALLAKFNKKADIWTVLTDEDMANDFALYCKVADAVDDMPTVGGWISVKDRLPERECIAYSSKFDEMMMGYIGETDKSDTGYCCESNTEWLSDVTHWMPLPEPPKEGAKND